MKTTLIDASRLETVHELAKRVRISAEKASVVENHSPDNILEMARSRGSEIIRERDRRSGVSHEFYQLALDVRAFDRALAHYNRLRALEHLPALDRNQAMDRTLDRTLEAIQIMDGSTAAPQAPIFDPATEIVLREIGSDPYAKAGSYLGNVKEIVREAARKAGLGRVSPRQALLFLTEAAYPPENTRALEEARREAFRNHAEVGFEYVREQARHGRDVGHWMDEWLEGFAASNVQRLYENVSNPATYLAVLRKAARRDASASELWLEATLAEIEAMRALPVDKRAAAIESFADDFKEVVPSSILEPILKDARAGSGKALATLAENVRQGAAARALLTVSKDANESVRSVRMPEINQAMVLTYSGDNHWGVNIRNMGIGEESMHDTIRRRGWEASRDGRPVRFLELTHGLPLSAVEWTEPRNFRSGSRHGDQLQCWQPGGHMSREPLRRFDTKRTEATVITPKNLLAPYFDGRIPETFQRWYDTWDSLAGFFEPRSRKATLEAQRAAADHLVASGRLALHEGDAVDELRALSRRGDRFDIAICPELSWTADRIRLLEALQHALLPGGRAFVSIETWSPRGMPGDGAGVEDIKRVADVVRTGAGDIPLEDWLAKTYPAAFEVAHYTGARTLLVKGTVEPARFPEMTAEDMGRTVQLGFPALRWTVVTEQPEARRAQHTNDPEYPERRGWGIFRKLGRIA